VLWSQKRKAASSKSSSRQRHRGTSTERSSLSWQQEAEKVLQTIVDSPDSVPFRNAVSIDEFPVRHRHWSKLSAQRNETEAKLFLKLFRFNFISVCGQFKGEPTTEGIEGTKGGERICGCMGGCLFYPSNWYIGWAINLSLLVSRSDCAESTDRYFTDRIKWKTIESILVPL